MPAPYLKMNFSSASLVVLNFFFFFEEGRSVWFLINYVMVNCGKQFVVVQKQQATVKSKAVRQTMKGGKCT